MRGADDFAWHVALATIVMVCLFFFITDQVSGLSHKLDALQATQDQTVDFLSDLHAERAK